MDRTV